MVVDWLVYPKSGQRLDESDANKVQCCLPCRRLRNGLNIGAFLADCLNRPAATPDVQQLQERLALLAAAGADRAASEQYNLAQALRFAEPGGMRIAKLRPLLARGKGKCVWCRKPLGLNHSEVSVEHLVPQSQGGGDDPANLLPACRSCNSRRGSKSPVKWILQLLDEGYYPQIRVVGQSLQELSRSSRKRQAKRARQWNEELIDLVPMLQQRKVPFD